MNGFDRLQQETRDARAQLVSVPVIQQALRGKVGHETYVEFLRRAYHHVRHTVPLLMAVGSRLPERLDWLQREMVEYVNEELGHEKWILNDIQAAGSDASVARASAPGPEVDAMVGYAYDTVMRRNPVGFFGMVFVLEGTSAALALDASEGLQRGLGLTDRAFTYLRSHGRLDQEHVGHLANIVNRLEPDDVDAVIHCARTMFWLYANVFRSLPAAGVEPLAAPLTGTRA